MKTSGSNKNSSDEEPTKMMYCPEDECLNESISRLHNLARVGTYYDCIQQHIDGYLAAVAFLKQNPSRKDIARKMVCNHMISPQVGNLPDICQMIRSILDGSHEKYMESHAFQCLFHALPCIKKNTKKQVHINKDFQISINVLLGLLLGLYPSSLKFPQFNVRVNIYRRIHCLLTHGTGVDFCSRHKNLFALAYMEYCSYVLTNLLPAEYEALSRDTGMVSFMNGCSLNCDLFRQENVITGEESWSSLDKACSTFVERHWRSCKNRVRVKGFVSNICLKISHAQSRFYMDIPFLYPYAVHHDDSSNCIMAGEMKFLVANYAKKPPDLCLENAVSIQKIINVHVLPRNLTNIQIKSIARQMQVCERSAMNGNKLHLCIPCILRSPNSLKSHILKGMCKMDVDDRNFICSYCANPDIVQINTMGRIVCIRNQKFYYAPCCNSVQVYTGQGNEFSETLDRQSMQVYVPCHHYKVKKVQRVPRNRCAVCGNVSTQESHTAVDHLTGAMNTIFLCGRHTPNQFALRNVSNWSQLMEEVLKRDKPLFSISSLRS
jgi:hypothetical protein